MTPLPFALLVFSFLACGLATAEPMNFFAFDKCSIPWHDNLKLALVPAVKRPQNPVLRTGPEGVPDRGTANVYGTVFEIHGTDVPPQRILFPQKGLFLSGICLK